jgi:TRAP-type C4-dicarboxylate transport system substrate-binding protein
MVAKRLGWCLAAVLVGLLSFNAIPQANAADAKVVKISHQFPGGTIDQGDFRDRLCRKFAAEVEKRTGGALKFEIYPSASLVKDKQQFNAMATGALDMSLYPLAYAGGQVPEVNITLMPALVTSYEQGLRWKDAPIGKELSRILEEKGVKILTWIWQGGGMVSKNKPVVEPADANGLKIRGGGKSMDLMLKAAGAALTSIPSSEIYNALQQGVIDGALTSSGSLVSFRLYEQGKHVTSARDKTFWFMFEPLLISKATFDSLTPEQQKIMTEVGASLEQFAIEAAKQDDQDMAKAYVAGGATVHDMNEATFNKWREIAMTSAWKDFEDNTPNGKALMDMAKAVK